MIETQKIQTVEYLCISTVCLVHQEGFEPPTFRFVAEHSIQLSYSCIFINNYYYTYFFCIFQVTLAIFLIKYLANQIILCYIIISVLKFYILFRGVAQLVARVVWDHEVAGSIPVTSTTLKDFLRNSRKFQKSLK